MPSSIVRAALVAALSAPKATLVAALSTRSTLVAALSTRSTLVAALSTRSTLVAALSTRSTLVAASTRSTLVAASTRSTLVTTPSTLKARLSLVAALFLFAATCAINAQSTLPEWNQQRTQRTRYSMYVLGGWAAANIASGAIGMARTKGADRAFYQMNLGWGLINAGLATSGIWTAAHTDYAALNWWDSQQELQRIRQIFLFNAGLDVGYIAAGAWMTERAKNTQKNADRWRGFGRSIILQGAFLFVFDLGAFAYHGPLSAPLKNIMPDKMGSLFIAPSGVSWRYSL